MTDDQSLLEDEDDNNDEDGNPIPPHIIAEQKHTEELFSAYQRKFGEGPPMFSMPPDRGEQLDMIENALKTGQPIHFECPPDCVL